MNYEVSIDISNLPLESQKAILEAKGTEDELRLISNTHFKVPGIDTPVPCFVVYDVDAKPDSIKLFDPISKPSVDYTST